MNIETTRLILRRLHLADVPALFEFLGDAEAMRYTHADASLRECRRRLAVHEWRRRCLCGLSFLLLMPYKYALVHRMDTPLNPVSPIPDAPLQSEATDGFTDVSVARLTTMSPETLNNLPYGVIGTAPDGTVEVYNAAESRLAGLSANRVLGQHLFTVVAPCMNNYLVAQRFEDEVELNVVVPYVLTLRMRPTAVKLRLLRTPDQARRFLLIQR